MPKAPTLLTLTVPSSVRLPVTLNRAEPPAPVKVASMKDPEPSARLLMVRVEPCAPNSVEPFAMVTAPLIVPIPPKAAPEATPSAAFIVPSTLRRPPDTEAPLAKPPVPVSVSVPDWCARVSKFVTFDSETVRTPARPRLEVKLSVPAPPSIEPPNVPPS